MSPPLEDIEFLARSPHRVEVLEALAEAPRTRHELKERAGVSRVTIKRLVDDLSDRGWIDREEGQSEATAMGRVVAREFARLRSNLSVADDLEAARETLEDHPGMRDRVDLVERDFEEEELPDGHDVAFLGQIVHGLTPEGNRALFEKLSRATKERGTVAILDQVADPPSSSSLPFNPMDSSFSDGVESLLGFGLFVFTGGRSYRYDDLESWLAEAGFSDVSYQGLPKSPGMSLVVASKPGGAG